MCKKLNFFHSMQNPEELTDSASECDETEVSACYGPSVRAMEKIIEEQKRLTKDAEDWFNTDPLPLLSLQTISSMAVYKAVLGLRLATKSYLNPPPTWNMYARLTIEKPISILQSLPLPKTVMETLFKGLKDPSLIRIIINNELVPRKSIDLAELNRVKDRIPNIFRDYGERYHLVLRRYAAHNLMVAGQTPLESSDHLPTWTFIRFHDPLPL